MLQLEKEDEAKHISLIQKLNVLNLRKVIAICITPKNKIEDKLKRERKMK